MSYDIGKYKVIEIKEAENFKKTKGLDDALNRLCKKYRDEYEVAMKRNPRAVKSTAVIELANTKDLSLDIINKLDDDIYFKIDGGINTSKSKYQYKNSYDSMFKRNIYTKKQLMGIIRIFESIESKIDPNWNDLDKAMFYYKKLCEGMNYNRDNINGVETYNNLLGLITRSAYHNGLAMMYKEAMDRLGIPCLYQTGKYDMAWNVIKVNNKLYGVDLGADVAVKENNKCGYRGFGRTTDFYKGYRDITYDNDEKMYNLSSFTDNELLSSQRKIENDNSHVKLLSDYEERNGIKVAGQDVIINGGIPYIANKYINNAVDPRYTFFRDDNTTFMLFPTGKKDNDINEYIYCRYDKESKTFFASNVYSELKMEDIMDKRKDIGNTLFSEERMKDKINNYHGYAGFIVDGDSKLYSNVDYEKVDFKDKVK